MFKETPTPVRMTFWKHTLLYCAIVAFGSICGIAIGDKELLFLTAAIAALGAWRTIHLYQLIHHAKYRILEGMVVSDAKRPLRKGHCVTMQMDDGGQINEIVSGGLLFTPGHIYRIYLHSSVESEVVSALPEALRPVQTLLGYERID